MNLTDLANLGEFIGGIAVLITLAYLAVQLRQGAKMAQANAVATLLARYESPNALLSGSSEASRVFRVGMDGSESLSPDEAMQFQCMMMQFMAVLHAAYLFHKDRIISPEQWEIYRRDISEFANLPGQKNMMAYFKSYYSPDIGFVRVLENMETEQKVKSGPTFMETLTAHDRGRDESAA